MSTLKPIILLDLNYTLAENSREVVVAGRFYDVAAERYRTWLIKMLDGFRVILITVRPERYKAETMERIASLTGWQPDEAYFNEWGLKAPQCKQRALETYVFPDYGAPCETPYLALESNDDTAEMYRNYGIGRYRALEIKGKPHLLLGEQSRQQTLF